MHYVLNASLNILGSGLVTCRAWSRLHVSSVHLQQPRYQKKKLHLI